MFLTVTLSINRSFSLYTQQWFTVCRTGLLTACEQDQDGTSFIPLWHIPLLCVQWKTPDGGLRNCPKHVEFYSKNKFEKLLHLFGFIIRNFHDARSPENQTSIINMQMRRKIIKIFGICFIQGLNSFISFRQKFIPVR